MLSLLGVPSDFPSLFLLGDELPAHSAHFHSITAILCYLQASFTTRETSFQQSHLQTVRPQYVRPHGCNDI